MEELLKYIEKLESESFRGWNKEAEQGYRTACISIKEKIKEILKEQNTINKIIQNASIEVKDTLLYTLLQQQYNRDIVTDEKGIEYYARLKVSFEDWVKGVLLW